MTPITDATLPAFDQAVRIDAGWRLRLTEPRDGRRSLIITGHQHRILRALLDSPTLTIEALTTIMGTTRAAAAGRVATLEHRRLVWAPKHSTAGNSYALTRLGRAAAEAIEATR